MPTCKRTAKLFDVNKTTKTTVKQKKTMKERKKALFALRFIQLYM